MCWHTFLPAASWFTFAKKYPAVWGINSFVEFAAWRTQENPNISLHEWDNYQYFQEYYKIYPEGRTSEVELEQKAREYDQEETKRLDVARKQLTSQSGHHASGLGGVLLAPLAALERYRLSPSLQADERYKNLLSEIQKNWEKGHPGKTLGETILYDKTGNPFLNPNVFDAIPDIHQVAGQRFRQKYKGRARRYDKAGKSKNPNDYSLDPKIQKLFSEIPLEAERIYGLNIQDYKSRGLAGFGLLQPNKQHVFFATAEELALEYVKDNTAQAELFAAQHPLIAEALTRYKVQKEIFSDPTKDPVFQGVEKRIQERTTTELAEYKKLVDQKTNLSLSEAELKALVRRSEFERFAASYPQKAAAYAATNKEIREAYHVVQQEQAERERQEGQIPAEKIYERYLAQKPGGQKTIASDFVRQNPLSARELAEKDPEVKRAYEEWRRSLQEEAVIPAPREENASEDTFEVPRRRAIPPSPPPQRQESRPSLQRPRLPRLRGPKRTPNVESQVTNVAKRTAMRLAVAYGVPIGVALLMLMLIVLIIVFICVILGQCTLPSIPSDGTTNLTISKSGPVAVSNSENITYTITVNYSGPATTVRVTDTVSGDVEYVDSSREPVSKQETGGKLRSVTWEIPVSDTSTQTVIQANDSCQPGTPENDKWAPINEYDAYFARAATEFGVPANLLKAMAMIESAGQGHIDPSTGKPWERDDGFGDGLSIGLMQVKPGIWQSLVPDADAYDPLGNIRLGAAIMAKAIEDNGSWENAIRRVYLPTDDPNGTSQDEYINTVKQYIAELDAAPCDGQPSRPSGSPNQPPSQGSATTTITLTVKPNENNTYIYNFAEGDAE